MNRREFIKTTALKSAGASLLGSVAVPNVRANPSSRMIDPRRMLVGTLVIPESIIEDGISESLDRMQELAGINTVMTFTHRHVAQQYRPGNAPPTDRDGNELTNVWVRSNPERYAHPALQGKNLNARYADFDILDALRDEAHPQGMRVYARILEPYVITGAIPGFEEWPEVNALGEPTDHVCFNHPGYIRYWDSVIDDLIQEHPWLEGFKFGQERGGPLLESLAKNRPGKCFCPHCRTLARKRGLDIENARRGFIAVQDYGERIRAGEELFNGRFVEFLRLLVNYPTLLPWEQFWMDSREDQRRRIYARIKSIQPGCQVGWHLDHGMTWDLVSRATADYSTLGSHSDWLSVALYFDSMGRRSLGHYERNYRDILLGDATEDISYPMYLSLLGYDPRRQPSLDQHRAHDTAFDPEYVYAECRRVVNEVKGAAQVHARIGFDMPGYDCNVMPDQVRTAVDFAFRAGVDGFWVGREWDELTTKNIRAYGEALRAHLDKT